jgi:hypothetical protein
MIRHHTSRGIHQRPISLKPRTVIDMVAYWSTVGLPPQLKNQSKSCFGASDRFRNSVEALPYPKQTAGTQHLGFSTSTSVYYTDGSDWLRTVTDTSIASLLTSNEEDASWILNFIHFLVVQWVPTNRLLIGNRSGTKEKKKKREREREREILIAIAGRR